MAYQVLARKYRPQRFSDVVGQDHVTVTLMNALRQNRIAHGYIFSGHRGIGKTTIARILAMALNCRNTIGSELRPSPEPCEICESCTEIKAGNAVDVIEIDAATNRGIDEIRELRDAARYRPSRDKYKIYILDEAHQITDAAFNALLKTLEEPPDHMVFMMATTQPEDIPQTVRSRCQHFSFHAVKLADILSELRGIALKEGVLADDSALALLAEAGDGSMRDALSIMDQAIASAPYEDAGPGEGQSRPVLNADQIRELMGTVPNAVYERMLEAISANNAAQVITTANTLLDAGNSPAQLARQFCRYLRNAVIAKIAGLTPEGTLSDGSTSDLLQLSIDEQRRAARTATLFTEEELTRFLQVMLRTFDELGYRQEQRFHFELGLLKLVHLQRLLPLEEALSQLPSSGRVASPKSPPATSSTTTSPGPPAAPRPAPQPVVAAKPAFSPFERDRDRKTPTPTPPQTSSVPSSARAPAPAPVPDSPIPGRETSSSTPEISTPQPLLESQPAGQIAPPSTPVQEAAQFHRSNVSPAPEQVSPADLPPAEGHAPPATSVTDTLQQLAVEALASENSQSTAADAMADATFTLAEGLLTIQTALSKTMLPLVFNPDAERIARNAILADTPGLRVRYLPASPSSESKDSSAPKKPRAARSGSAQAKALEHPIVQQAQSLFNAEVRTVIDLHEQEK